MKALKLGEVEDFPFVEAPVVARDRRRLRAAGRAGRGRRRAPAHADRRAARRAADRPAPGAHDRRGTRRELPHRDADHRRRPGHPGSARSSDGEDGGGRHRPTPQFADERSEFLGLLKLWAFFDDALKHRKSNRKLAQLCREHFLSYVRLREWRDLHGQLHAQVSEMGWRLNETAGHLRAAAPRVAGRAARQHRLQVRGPGRVSGRARHQVRHLSRARR